MSTFTITAGSNSTGPFGTGDGEGYASSDGVNFPQITHSTGVAVAPPITIAGALIGLCCNIEVGAGGTFNVMLLGTHAQNFFGTISFVDKNGTTQTFNTAVGATFDTTTYAGYSWWHWVEQGHFPFNAASNYVMTVTFPAPSAPPGKGDITNPNSWEDSNGNIPPKQFTNVPQNTNYPLNGDGRYWFQANANTPAPSGSPIHFIGDTTFYTGEASLQWSVTQVAPDGSGLLLSYSTDGGVTWTDTTLLPQTQLKGIQNGQILVALAGCTGLQVRVTAQGGTANPTAILSQVAVAITRNANESVQWDTPNPFNPEAYNGQCMDEVVPTDTLANLRKRILIRLGFASQAANPPPGMAPLVNDFLISAQTYLYRRYKQLHTTRMFRWKLNPLQRMYSLKDNDEDVLCDFQMDPLKTIEWAGIQDSRNVWYPLIEGIPPQLYTMIDKPWRPARYEIRQMIEVYPAPDQTYWMWMKAHFGLRTFAADGDKTTLDSELVFLWALGNAKAHYGQADGQNITAQANAYRLELIGGTHGTTKYIPGATAIPPAIRPTLISFQNS